jgi:hypothetical protein
MNTPLRWAHEQTSHGRRIYLMLDACGQLEAHHALVRELGIGRYRNLYARTAADSVASTAPHLFLLDTVEHPALQALLNKPEQHWGWLASGASTDLDALAAHWQARLVTGERPTQALYRFQDNRVIGRALTALNPEQYPHYLGPLISVCYWQADQWTVVDNPEPGIYPVPADPAWLSVSTPQATSGDTLFKNTRRYLTREHAETLSNLTEHKDIDVWLRDHLELARTWGWQKPEHIQFLLTQSLRTQDYALPHRWSPGPHETPLMHFDRLYRERLYWQGDAPL